MFNLLKAELWIYLCRHDHFSHIASPAYAWFSVNFRKTVSLLGGGKKSASIA